ncbi:MAG: hypothetical protein ACFFEK_02015 [Candidatus Thorarchaeota archaeon]
MQVFDPYDPTMILLYGLIVTIIVLLYASRVRRSPNPVPRSDDVSSMAGGRVEEITTGAVQEPMLDHLVSIEEEREEHEGEDL